MRFGRIFYVIVLLVCALEFARLWNITPAQMAAHFNIQGNPDRFASKTEFFWDQLQTLLTVVGVSLLPQLVFLVMPMQLINLPNREYWLAPERREETLSRLSSFAAIVFGIILLVIQAAFELSAYANLHAPVRFNAQSMLMIMVASFVVIGFLLFCLIVSFRRLTQID